jgi:thiamine biosynthesis lipoprotein
VLLRMVILVGCVAVPFACKPGNQLAHFDGNTMGSTYDVTYVPKGGSIEQQARAVEELLARINDSVSTYVDTSVISRVNTSTDTSTWFPIDAHFEANFRRARAAYDDTNGAFDPTVGPLINAWGFGPPSPQPVPDEGKIRDLLRLVNFDAFELRDSPPAIRKKIAGSQLDFGGIAKGYAVDAMAAMLEQAGVTDYLVQIAGHVRAHGQRQAGQGWRVGIEKPAENPVATQKIQSVIVLENASLATSGNYRNYRTEDGKTFGHILNPKTGYPVENSLLSATVIAPDATAADAYATALIVMGLDEAMKFVEKHKSLHAYFIAKDAEGNLIEKRSSGFPVN